MTQWKTTGNFRRDREKIQNTSQKGCGFLGQDCISNNCLRSKREAAISVWLFEVPNKSSRRLETLHEPTTITPTSDCRVAKRRNTCHVLSKLPASKLWEPTRFNLPMFSMNRWHPIPACRIRVQNDAPGPPTPLYKNKEVAGNREQETLWFK